MALTNPNLTTEQIRDVNVRYHDAAAESYDSKWAIDYGPVGARQVLMKLGKALGHEPGHYPRALEIGAGTGYFTINLLTPRRHRPGDRHGHLTRNAAPPGLETADELGLEVATTCADAEHLPFEDRANSTSCSAMPCCTTCPIFPWRWRSSGGCSRPVERWLSWASPPGTETAWRSRRSASERSPRRSGGGSWGRSPRSSVLPRIP